MDMKYTAKRFFSILLTLMLVLNMLPASAISDGATVPEGSQSILVGVGSPGDAYHTVEISVESGFSWEGRLYFIMKQEQVNTPQGPYDQYYVGEISRSGGNIQAQTFKAAYWGGTDNPYDNTKDTTVLVGRGAYNINDQLDSRTPINNQNGISYITEVDNKAIVVSTDNRTNTTTIKIGDTSTNPDDPDPDEPDPTDNTDTIISIESDETLDISGYNYLLVGWNRGNESYESRRMDSSLTGDYRFNAADIPSDVHETLFVVLKHYDTEPAETRDYSGTALVANNNVSANPNTLEIGEDTYTFTMTDVTEQNGIRHFTIHVEKQAEAGHVAAVQIADGVPRSFNYNGQNYANMYVVFRQPIPNSAEKAYCAVPVNGNGIYECAPVLTYPNGGGQQAFSATADTEVVIMMSAGEAQSWMFTEQNFGNSNNVVYRNAALYPDNNAEDTVTIAGDTADPTRTNISIGIARYTARLDLYDAWNTAHTDRVDFTAPVTMTATDSQGTTYTAVITGNGEITSDGWADLPGDITGWTFSATNLDGYQLTTTPEKVGTVYVFQAHKPDTYNVRILYLDAWDEVGSYTADLAGTGTIYATDAAGTVHQGTINTDGSVDMDPVPEIRSWRINSDDMIGDYAVRYSEVVGSENPTIDNGTHTYILKARIPRTYQVEIEYYDSWNRGKIPAGTNVPVGEGYTIRATDTEGNVHIGEIDAANGKVSFGGDIPEIAGWQILYHGAAEDPQMIGEFKTDFGPGNPSETARYDAEINNAVGYYLITATKPNTYSASLSFFDEQDEELGTVSLTHTYTIKATDENGTIHTGTVAVDGTVTWEDDKWPKIVSFEFYDETGSTKVTRFDGYLPEVESYSDADLLTNCGEYRIIARKARLYPSRIEYMPENTSLTHNYYIVASVENTRVAYAAVPASTGRLSFIPFGSASGILNLPMMLAGDGETPSAETRLPSDATFILVESDTALDAAVLSTAAASPAKIEDYSLELEPVIEKKNDGSGSADEDTLVFKAQKKWTGNTIKISTYDYDGQNLITPETHFGEDYFLRVMIRDIESGQDVGWNLIPVDEWKTDEQGDTATITVNRFTTLASRPLDPQNKAWTNFDPTKHYIEVDTDEYPARVVKITDKNQLDWEKANRATVANDEPPEGFKYFKGVQESDCYRIRLKKAKPIDYFVRLKFDTTDTTKINLDGGLYVKVTIGHQSGEDTYGWEKIDNANYKKAPYMTVDTQAGCTYIDVPITNWKNGQGDIIDGEKYKGTEHSIKVELVGGNDQLRPSGSTPMKTGAYVNNAELIAYPTFTDDVDHFEEDDNTDPQNPREKVRDVVSLSIEPDKFDGYSLDYILNGYNIVTLCPNTTASPSKSGESAFGDGDFLMKNHCMGGVLVRGDIIHITGTGVADSEFITKPSVIGGYVPANMAPFINNRENNNHDWNAYVGSVNTVVGETVNGVTASGSPSKPRPDGTIRGYTGSAGHTAAYGDTYIDWDKLQKTVRETSDSLAESSRVRDDVIYGNQYETFREVNVDVTMGDNVTINYPEGVKLIVNIIAPEGLDLTNSKNIPCTIINNTGTGTYIAPKVKVNGKDLTTTEDGSGMSLVWNYPYATEVDLTTEVTPFFGHIVAPRSYINVEGGNYSGCMVGNKVSSAGEGHLYPYNGGKLILTDVGFEATKTIDDETPESDKLFYFELDELDRDGSLAGTKGQWVQQEIVRNTEGGVRFEEIKYEKPGTYYYKISEYQHSVSSGIRLDTTQYLVKTVVTGHISAGTNTLTATQTYFRVPEGVTDYLQADTDGNYILNEDVLTNLNVPEGKTGAEIAAEYLTFNNTSNENNSIKITKTLNGKTLEEEQFSFSIVKKSGPEDYVGSVDESKLVSPAKNNAGGVVNFGKLSFTLQDGQNQGVWVYTVKEVQPDPIPEDYTYDPSEYEITFTVTRGDGTLNVNRSIRRVKDNQGRAVSESVSGINFVNTYEEKKGDLEISKTVVSPYTADLTKQFSFTVTLTDKDDRVLSGTFGGYTFDANGRATITVAGGSSAQITGLPIGAKYTVTEAVDEDYELTNKTGDSGMISENKSTAAFTNTRKLGKLKISKQVTGTSDTDKLFHFKITLKYRDAALSGTYPVSGTTAAVATATDLEGHAAIPFNEDGEAIVRLKAGQDITVENLPLGTAYTVEEYEDYPLMPFGYEKTAPAETKAQGTITENENGNLAQTQFVNQYTQQTISVTFGGKKLIEGRNSTDKQFTFELFETGANFTVADDAEPLDSYTTTGTIGTNGSSYAFDTITYDSVGTHYYVIRERIPENPEGWTCRNPREYHETVTISINNDGEFVKTVTATAPDQLNFTNSYEATGKVSFKAKKVFTNGTLGTPGFQVKLTQVKSGTDMTPVDGWNLAPVTVDTTTGEAVFTDVKLFNKNSTTDDTQNTYWFLLEEVLPTGVNETQPISNGIKYDTSKKLIQVTLTDNGKGTLTAVKEPAEESGLDITFTNEQLGDIKVTKSFSGVDALPAGFKIKANWKIGETSCSDTFTVENAKKNAENVTIVPYEWEITNLPIDTVVSFEEEGITIDGYTTTVKFNDTASADAKGELTVAKGVTAGNFVNTYERDKGSLKIQKTLTVNGSAPTTTDYALVNGTYQFRLQSIEGVTPAIDQKFTIAIENGNVTSAVFVDPVNTELSIVRDTSVATLSGLPTGKYTVTEELTAAQTASGIKLTAKPETSFTIVKDGEGVQIQTAAFTNNKDVGELEISKSVSGTTDKTKAFTFLITLTAPDGITLADSYPADYPDGCIATQTDLTNKTISFDADHQATVRLKADQSIVIKNLPAGTSYTVHEQEIPAGYEQTSPSGDPTGTITTTRSVETFVNTYSLNTTSVTFGGRKMIEGTDSTDQAFTFELYETDSGYQITNPDEQLVERITLQGPISKVSGKSYSFTAITYTETGTHYYVIKEQALNKDETGWTTSTTATEYHECVEITDGGNGQLNKKVTGTEPDQLNFTNSYEATGKVSFKAKKVFIGGTMDEKSFSIKLSRADEDGKPIPNENIFIETISSGTAGEAVFTDVMSFQKKQGRDDTQNTYWFLLEEVVPEGVDKDHPISEGIRYDTNKQLIKVTLTDNGNGTLTAVKEPAEDNGLDITFTNEQLGSVKVSKTFTGHEAPDGFAITAAYEENGKPVTRTLKTGAGTDIYPEVGVGTEKTYTWTISNLPIGTVVTFTESGYTVDGYSVTSTFTNTVEGLSGTTSGTVKAAKAPTTGVFVNTYTRDKGSLKIKKIVTVNGSTENADFSLVDGDYTFTVSGVANTLTAGITGTVKVTVYDGAVTAASVTDTTPAFTAAAEGGCAVISELPTGRYVITETIDPANMTAKGIVLADPTGNSITLEVTTGTEDIPVAEFTNNKDVGELEISKSVSGTTDRSKEFTFEVELTPPSGGITLESEYPVTYTVNGVATATDPNAGGGKLTFTGNKATVTLKGDESIIIHNLPAGTTFTVKENDPPAGYGKTSPTGDATGSVAKAERSVAAFINDYTAGPTSVIFGGTKTIQGTDSTTQVFTFELFETDSTFTVRDNQAALRTATTTGKLTSAAAQNFTFDPIEYTEVGTHYYVIKEKALDPNNGWTIDSAIYHETVVVSDAGEGRLTHSVTGTKAGTDGAVTPSGHAFVNTYRAEGKVSFHAKKIFRNGNLSQHPFAIKVTQVTGDGSETAVTGAPAIDPITVNANGTTQTADFTDVRTFVKTIQGRDDTIGEYWFLIEEVLPNNVNQANPIQEHVKYDTAKKWIRVTVTDKGNGTLEVTKDPAEKNGLDVTFTNEQLGDVAVSKTFKGHAAPDGFTITASYKKNGTTVTKTLTTGEGTDINPVVSGTDSEKTYTWTISNLPIGTVVTFTESGYTVDGYSLTSTYTNTAENKTGTTSGTVTAAKDLRTGAFVNTYTRDEGSLKIKKIVTVNSGTPSTEDYALVDGDYTFTVSGAANTLTAGITRTVTVRVSGGAITAASVSDGTTTTQAEIKGGFAVISGLPTGRYMIAETIDPDNMTAKGIVLADPAGNSITLEVTTDPTDIPAAEFTNNKDIGELEISKSVTGTEDKTKAFTFLITLTAPVGVTLENSYPADYPDGCVATQSDLTARTISFDANHQATVQLKADESIIIKNLPAGTSYTVHEQGIPEGYEQTSPSGDPTGTITTTRSVEAFINTYRTGTTSVTFGGRKMIAGTDSTDQAFTFELYETESDYQITDANTQLVERITLQGPVSKTSGKSYNFTPITYSGAGTHFYVIKEQALDKDETGWTTSETEYHECVEITDGGNGQLNKNITGTAPDQLNFTNTYEATGTVSFKAKKVFTGGTMSTEQSFTIRLTQVDASGNKISGGIEKTCTINSGTEGEAIFADVLSFVKKEGQDDTNGIYWFLLEEVVPQGVNETQPISGGVKYDTNKRLIKVTLTDNGMGTLTAVKEPAENDGLDITFTNEQLGSVQVSKTFTGHAVPDGFNITAAYEENGKPVTRTLKTGTGSDIDPVKSGTDSEPTYTWTIDNLPIGTVVTFTESGYTVDGYSVTSTFTNTAENTTGTTSGTVTTAKAPATGVFVNTYTRDKGSLKIKKTVLVNGVKPGTADNTLVDGTYQFKLTGPSPLTDVKTVSVTIREGKVTAATISNNNYTAKVESGVALIEGLETGTYQVEEVIDPTGMTAKGISLISPTGNTVTVTVKKTGTIPTAEFRNNKNIGELAVSKTVSGTTDKTKEFTFEVTLTAPTGITLESTYPAVVIGQDGKEKTEPKSVTLENGKVTPDVTLKADETLIIMQLPEGTVYSVTEKTPPAGYEKTSPAADTEGGSILENNRSVAAFVNSYTVGKTSVTFGGTKAIMGTSSTTRKFTFELYETGEDYQIRDGQEPKERKETTGTLTSAAAQNYSFTPIEFTEPVTKYYVIREKALDPANGWSVDETVYEEKVVITDGGSGQLVKTVTGKKQGESGEGTDNANALNFTNTYKATGSVSFKAKKVFTGGTMSTDQSFTICLTQAGADGNPVQNGYSDTRIISSGTEGEVDFTDVMSFVKKDGQDDTQNTYWFLLEEAVPTGVNETQPISGGIKYDTSKKLIKVTLTDNGMGTLTAVKEPAEENGLDVTFTNEQLGDIKVTKSFSGVDALPAGFKIKANWKIGETNYSDTFTVGNAKKEQGQTVYPYEWEITNLPIDTVVSFEEESITIDGYTTTVRFNDTVSTDAKGELTVARGITEGRFVNTYERDKGSLKIQKTLTVNGSTPSAADCALVDGTYQFRLQSIEGVTPAINQVFTITLADGKVTAAVFDPANTELEIVYDAAEATLSKLPTGKYTVTEELTPEQTASGIKLTAKPETSFTIVKDGEGVQIQTAAFTNNRDVGDLEISKSVSGTTDKTKAFTFLITLTAPDGITLADSYPADYPDGCVATPNDLTAGTISFDANHQAVIRLKADQKAVIRNLPAGTGYKVEEIQLPDGYEKITGYYQDTIVKGTNKAPFANQYKLGTTSVTFGGKKYIEGTESTDYSFTFELYEADENFNTVGDAVQTIKTKDTIGTEGLTYSFEAITYEADDKGKTFRYVIRESVHDEDGWTCDTTVYNATVTVSDDGNGKLNAAASCVKAGTTTAADADKLDFTNRYEAKGTASFLAKKVFTNGDLYRKGFLFRLTQVSGENKTDAPAAALKVLASPIEKQVKADKPETSELEVSFALDADVFRKGMEGDALRDDTLNEYWFMLEEVVPTTDANGIAGGIRYETAARKWIKVTLEDDGKGGLTATNHPTAALDAVFINEQLGSVQVSKVFRLNGATQPKDFQIIAEYTVGGRKQQVILTPSDTTGRTGSGTEADPYIWTIGDLPIGTEVSFTESGMTVDGYTVASTFTNTAEGKTGTTAGTVTAKETALTGAFVNEYTRDEGSLKIKKIVTVNGSTPSAADYALVDGDYTFTISGAANTLTAGITRTVQVTVSKGAVTEATVSDGTATAQAEIKDGFAVISGLPTGNYTVSETISTDMTDRGIKLSDPAGNKITVEVKKNNTADIPPAVFTNNREVGKLLVSKTVERTTNTKIPFTFTITLKDEKGAAISGTFPAEWKLNNPTTADSVTFTNGTTEIQLCAKESVLISLLPGGATYEISEKKDNMPNGYEAMSPDASGTISRTLNEENFVNMYNLRGTTLTFGGKKSIAVASSTTQKFRFELYETDDDTFSIGKDQQPLEKAETDGKILAESGQNFTFGALTYEVATRGTTAYAGETHYYVIKEAALNENGWTQAKTLYKRKVVIKDGNNGQLVKEIYDEKGQLVGETKSGATGYNFTNNYKAEGTVTLSAKKLFKNALLKDHPFTVTLTQVTGDGSTTQATAGVTTVVLPAPVVKQFNADAGEQTITFDPISFVKEEGRDDTQTEFWFLIEESDPDPTAAVIMDPNPQRWIKVTLKDLDNGTLEAARTPAAAQGEPDVLFTNEKQISVKVQKTDVTTGEELTGAHIQILDGAGTVVEEWDSEKGTPHEVFGLEIGKTYTLRETVAPPGYTLTADTHFIIGTDGKAASDDTTIRGADGVLLVEDDVQRTSATIRKYWNDDGNRDGRRPLSLKAELLADGSKTGLYAVLSAENNWLCTLSNLPLMKDGKEIAYTWAEPAVDGYQLTGTAKTGTLTVLTNKHTPAETEISVRKVWAGEGTHPDSVKVQLYADGVAAGKEVTLSAANGWKYTWTGLCKYANPTGTHTGSKEIVYKVAETEIPEGYEAKITGSAAAGFVVTNTKLCGKLVIEKKFQVGEMDHDDEDDATTDFDVIKIWEDNDNRDGNRPESITVHLYAGGEEIKTAVLNEANGWKRHFGNLPKFRNGHPIHYSITEDPVEGYVTRIDGFTVYNRYVPETTAVVVRKVWNDAGYEAHRPLNVVMRLSNGMRVVLNEQNGWMASVSGLPTRVNGQPAVYTWTEESVMGYQMESIVTNGNVTTVTNKPANPETELGGPGKKTGTPEQFVMIGDYGTALGLDTIINHVGDCFD